MAEACEPHFSQLVPPVALPESHRFKETTELLCRHFIQEQVDGLVFTPLEHVEGSEQFIQLF